MSLTSFRLFNQPEAPIFNLPLFKWMKRKLWEFHFPNFSFVTSGYSLLYTCSEGKRSIKTISFVNLSLVFIDDEFKCNMK